MANVDSDSDDQEQSLKDIIKQKIGAAKRAHQSVVLSHLGARSSHPSVNVSRPGSAKTPDFEQSSTFKAITPTAPFHVKQEATAEQDSPVDSHNNDLATIPFFEDDSDLGQSREPHSAATASAAESVTSFGKQRAASARPSTVERPRKMARSDTSYSSNQSPDPLQESSVQDSRQPRNQKRSLNARLTDEGHSRSVSSTRSPASQVGSLHSIPPQGPDWYSGLQKANTRAKGTSSITDTKLAQLRSRIKECKDAKEGGPLSPNKYAELIDILHDAMFFDVTGQLVRNHFLLHRENGLPFLFSSAAAASYPFYIRADAEELYNKWCNRVFTPDIFHGIKMNRDSYPSIVSSYELRKYGNEHGSNGLVNGQWFPTQLCAVRDGAHMTPQGGISGKSGEGAWSIILSAGEIEGGGTYPDIDEGETIQYCGTDGKEGEATDYTLRMKESVTNRLPVRVMRSSRAKNKDYRPQEGYRYDGLYDVVSYEILDREKQRHRFRLVRQEGQDPIRACGPEARPSRQEITALDKAKKEKKFIVGDGKGK